ncbi:NAD(P)/FAD-dependent oxidoreductase [Agrobacterium sp. NPDC090273]|uniref:NAD(P)/FAD-dependent oxidoreductase n=1 Tax=Agrobacterium sp. NPDC090273 TaxID=3363919 RepID=UPI00383AB7A6
MTETGTSDQKRGLKIAVIGTGISGLSAAWLLSKRHQVTVFEAASRIGGHSNTVDFESVSGPVSVDTGFIVYNEVTYPNLTALFKELDVPTTASNMSFAVSLNEGAFEYAGGTRFGLFAQKSNLLRPRFWNMLADLLRFYRDAPGDLPEMGNMSIDEYLTRHRYGSAFRDDHLYPMAAAIWSTPAMDVGRYPAAQFVKFCHNHGLLLLRNRPQWRTVTGGSREYVRRITTGFSDRIRLSTRVTEIRRTPDGIAITDGFGRRHQFDDVVIATHADQALEMLSDATHAEKNILGAFSYTKNRAVLHTDAELMPKRRAAWSSWNYVTHTNNTNRQPTITYWMNRLQPLGHAPETFVTLNPVREPSAQSVVCEEIYDHPVFDEHTERAQRHLWALQGYRNTWFCGAYFGSGFHEDGIQAGLAVAEDLGGIRRPWQVKNESSRIVRRPLAGKPNRQEWMEAPA